MTILETQPEAPARDPLDAQAMKVNRRQTRTLRLFEPSLIRMASRPIRS